MKRPSETSKNKEKDKSWIFILMLLLGLGVVFLSQKNENSSQLKNRNQVGIEHSKRVDSHLKDTSYNLEADHRQRQIEVYQQLNKLRESSAQSRYEGNKEFSLESDPYMQSLTHELNRSRQAPSDQATPAEIVEQRLFENEQFQKASEAYREAYARQFIENARQGGWEIQLGPDYEVRSVKKINERRTPSLFGEGQSGGGR